MGAVEAGIRRSCLLGWLSGTSSQIRKFVLEQNVVRMPTSWRVREVFQQVPAGAGASALT